MFQNKQIKSKSILQSDNHQTRIREDLIKFLILIRSRKREDLIKFLILIRSSIIFPQPQAYSAQ